MVGDNYSKICKQAAIKPPLKWQLKNSTKLNNFAHQDFSRFWPCSLPQLRSNFAVKCSLRKVLFFSKKAGLFRSAGGMVGEKPCTQRKNLLRVIWIRTKIVYTACYKFLLCLESNSFSHTNSLGSSNTNFVSNCYYNNRQDPYVLLIAKKKVSYRLFTHFCFLRASFFYFSLFLIRSCALNILLSHTL